ncbi:class F sortase [Streptomyces griseoloalbus]|uniref:class F sortase n=1 Tax=Streptomyces griseoloalbus TaxID=67303 RepID=UPI0033B35F65
MGSQEDTGRFPSGTGRLLAGVAWVVLLLGVWLWGREPTGVPAGAAGPATGDMAAAGRPPRGEPSPAHRPLDSAVPQRLDIPGLGVRAPVVAVAGDPAGRGALDAPPVELPGAVGWYADGTAPGGSGTAVMVGRVGTGTRPAAFHRVSTLRPGQEIRVVRADAGVTEFTVEDVQVLATDRSAAQRAYGPRPAGRAGLRLVACDGSADRAAGTCTTGVVVSAYATGTGR